MQLSGAKERNSPLSQHRDQVEDTSERRLALISGNIGRRVAWDRLSKVGECSNENEFTSCAR